MARPHKTEAQKRQKWLDFIEETAGSWQGDLERGDKGVAEERNWPTELYSVSDSSA